MAHWIQFQSTSWHHFVLPTGLLWVLSETMLHPAEQDPSLPTSLVPCFWFLLGLIRETQWHSEASRMVAICVVKWECPDGSCQAAESSWGGGDVSPISSRCSLSCWKEVFTSVKGSGSTLDTAGLWPHSSYNLTPSPHCGVDCGVMVWHICAMAPTAGPLEKVKLLRWLSPILSCGADPPSPHQLL